jgi:hypothetical protein
MLTASVIRAMSRYAATEKSQCLGNSMVVVVEIVSTSDTSVNLNEVTRCNNT